MRKILILPVLLMLSVSCSNNDDLMDNRQTLDNVTSKSSAKDAPPSPYIAYNGDFAKVTDQNPNGVVSVLYYVKFMGKWRHIDNQATWDGLFINKSFKYDLGSISSLSITTQTEIGSPIYIDNGLLQNPNNGRIYFREGNTLRWIPSMDIFNQYHFNPNAVIQSTATETSQYVQLADMSHTLL